MLFREGEGKEEEEEEEEEEDEEFLDGNSGVLWVGIVDKYCGRYSSWYCTVQ